MGLTPLCELHHRRENLGDGMRGITEAVRRIAQRPDVAVIFSVHLNPNVCEVMDAELAGLDNVALIEPLDYPNFARVLDIATLMPRTAGVGAGGSARAGQAGAGDARDHRTPRRGRGGDRKPGGNQH